MSNVDRRDTELEYRWQVMVMVDFIVERVELRWYQIRCSHRKNVTSLDFEYFSLFSLFLGYNLKFFVQILKLAVLNFLILRNRKIFAKKICVVANYVVGHDNCLIESCILFLNNFTLT